MPQTEQVLLQGDVDAIKEYVFETSSLPQMRGGSQFLIECENSVQKLVVAAGGTEVYCAGGSFLFEVPQDQAERLKRDIERVYLDATQVATVTVVYEVDRTSFALSTAPADGWARRIWNAANIQGPLDGGFAHHSALLAGMLRQGKAGKRETPFLEALPFGRRCDACGKRMAVTEQRRHEPEGGVGIEPALCPVCLARHTKGLIGEGQCRGKFNEEFDRFAEPIAIQAPDLDHLVSSAPRKYLALLYADGNDIGGLLQKAQNREQYRAISQALRAAAQRALFAALQEVCGAALQGKRSYWPFEIVNIGGDDVVALTQAGYAWDVAVKFLDGFEQGVQQEIRERLGGWPEDWPEKVTAACGIAIADVRYPIRYLRGLAEDLLKAAKRCAKQEAGTAQSALSFLWLSTAVLSEHAEPLLARYLHDNRALTARPYTLAQAQALTRLAAEAAQWPRTKRHRWGEAVEQGVLAAVNAIFYDVARSGNEERVWLRGFLSDVGQIIGLAAGSHDKGAPLWQIDVEQNLFRTALIDVLELAELRALRPDIRERQEVAG